MAQQDGGRRPLWRPAARRGESGVSVLSVRFDGGMHLLGTPRRHCIRFQMFQGHDKRRMAGRVVRLERPVESLTINPLGSVVPRMPTRTSIFLSSQSIRVGWRWQPRRVRCPRRS